MKLKIDELGKFLTEIMMLKIWIKSFLLSIRQITILFYQVSIFYDSKLYLRWSYLIRVYDAGENLKKISLRYTLKTL